MKRLLGFALLAVAVLALANNPAAAQVPGTPTLLSPLNKANVLLSGQGNAQVVLNWNSVSGATGYYVEWILPKLHNFTSHVVTNQLSTTITGLIVGDSVAWHVMASNASGYGDTSATWGFRVTGALPVTFRNVQVTIMPDELGVAISWATLSEINSYGFSIERSPAGARQFAEVFGSFTPGQGTTVEPHDYAYLDRTVSSGSWTYRIKETDRDGSMQYSDEATVSLGGIAAVGLEDRATQFGLSQNYPNPFNPATSIAFSVPQSAHARLAVYDLLGREVAVLLDANVASGEHHIRFDAGSLASGTYIGRLVAGGRVAVIRMSLVR
jgi:hypothetical protein